MLNGVRARGKVNRAQNVGFKTYENRRGKIHRDEQKKYGRILRRIVVYRADYSPSCGNQKKVTGKTCGGAHCKIFFSGLKNYKK